MGECTAKILRQRRFVLKANVLDKVTELYTKEGFEMLNTLNVVCQIGRERRLDLVLDLQSRSRGNLKTETSVYLMTRIKLSSLVPLQNERSTHHRLARN